MRILFTFFVFILLTFSGRCFGQQLFSATYLGNLELVTITANGIVTQPVPGCAGSNYFSIAALGSKLYYSTQYGTLYSADITPGASPAITNCKLIGSQVYTNGLTIDSDGVLYYANGSELYLFDPKNPVPIDLGTMPYYSAGDLTFYHNQLYMASTVGIVTVQLNDPSKSTLYIGGVNAEFLGLTTIIVNGVSTVYGSNGPQLVEVDMQKRVIKGTIGTITDCYDFASMSEAGTVAKVKLAGIAISRECNAFNKAQVRIYDKPDSGQHVFILNTGQTNTTGIFDNLSPGVYNAVVKSTLNELQKDTSFIVPDYSRNNPVVTINKIDPSCFAKGEITLDAGSADTLYNIQYGNDLFPLGHTFKNLGAQTYHFNILNKNGCISDEKDIALTFNCPIKVDSVQVVQECDAFNEANVIVFAAQHPDRYTYTLNTGQSDTTGTFDHLSPGNYRCVITSINGQLPYTVNFTVTDYTIGNPVIQADLINPVCNSPGQIKLDAGSASSLYTLKFGNGSFSFDHAFTGLSAGNYHFTVLNKNGCIVDEKDYSLKQSGCPPVMINSLDISRQCDALNQAQISIVCKPDSTQHTFTLNTGQTDTTGVFNNLPPGNYQLTITSNGNKSAKDTSFTIVDYSLENPVITIIEKKPICSLPGQLQLDAGDANSMYDIKYVNDVFNFDHLFTNLTAGSYHFTILNKQGCIIEYKDYVLLQDDCPLIILDSVKTAAECAVLGQASVTVFTQAHNAVYTYSLNGKSNNTGIFNFLTPGPYSLTISSSNGNNLTKDILVPDFTLNKPSVSYAVKNAVCALPGEINLTLIGGNTDGIEVKHSGNSYKLGETISGLIAGNNKFTFFNRQGCIIDTLDVFIKQDECNALVFPNAFTPNGDNINDTFRPGQDGNALTYKLLIFNRWGTLMFQSQTSLNGWDGKYNGQPAPFGVYYWITTYVSPDNKEHKLSGYVTLLR